VSTSFSSGRWRVIITHPDLHLAPSGCTSCGVDQDETELFVHFDGAWDVRQLRVHQQRHLTDLEDATLSAAREHAAATIAAGSMVEEGSSP
jgi:hypothetical protein